MTIGSVKSCFGHTEGAAGLTGALLAMQTLTFQVNCLKLKSHVKFQSHIRYVIRHSGFQAMYNCVFAFCGIIMPYGFIAMWVDIHWHIEAESQSSTLQ